MSRKLSRGGAERYVSATKEFRTDVSLAGHVYAIGGTKGQGEQQLEVSAMDHYDLGTGTAVIDSIVMTHHHCRFVDCVGHSTGRVAIQFICGSDL